MIAATKMLPLRPRMPAARALREGSNSFAQLDKIISRQLGRSGLSNSAKQYMAKARIDSPLHYARRSTFVAAILAWDRAKQWQDTKTLTRSNVKLQTGDIDGIIRATQRLKQAAERAIARRDSLPKISDPTVIMRSVKDFSGFETLLLATQMIENTFEELDATKAFLARLDHGRHDVLTDQFVENLAAIWKVLFGRYPATGKSGPFVQFADAAWSLVGWTEYSGRGSLGKQIMKKATGENWALLKHVKLPL